MLIGQILEQVYQENYETLVKREIESVLKLSNTYTNNFKPDMIVKGYNPEGGLQEPFVWNCVAPAGLIKASAEDMVTYLEAILSVGNNLSNAALLQEQTYFESERIAIGLGINMMEIGDNKVFAKTGDLMGLSSIMAYDRANNWGLIISINERNVKLRNMIFNEFVEILNGGSVK